MFRLFEKQEQKQLSFYFSCDDFPIWNFHKIMETSDYSYLVVDWDGIEVLPIDREKAVVRWGQIYNEYCRLTSNNKAITYYRNSQRLLWLETRSEVCGKMLVQMAMRVMRPEMFLEYIKVLRNFQIPYEKDVRDVKLIEDAVRFLKATKNQIDLLRDEIKKMIKTEEYVPFEKELVSVEQALGRNEVDPKKTSVTKWIFMIEKIKEIIEQQRKQSLKKS